MNRRHPLPWTMPGRDLVHVEPESSWHDGQTKPYKVRLGRMDSVSAALTEAELRALRDQLDAILAAPYRVLILGGLTADERDQRLRAALHARLDMLYTHHPRMEVAVTDALIGAGGTATDWCTGHVQVPVLVYQTAAAMVADGGNQAIVVMGYPDSRDGQTAAYQAHICTDRLPVEPTKAVGP